MSYFSKALFWHQKIEIRLIFQRTFLALISTKAIGGKIKKNFCLLNSGLHQWEVKGDLKCSSKDQVWDNVTRGSLNTLSISELFLPSFFKEDNICCIGVTAFFEFLRKDPVFLHGRTLHRSPQQVPPKYTVHTAPQVVPGLKKGPPISQCFSHSFVPIKKV